MDPKLISIFGIVLPFAAILWAVLSYFNKLKQDNFRTYADKYNEIIRPEIYDEWKACLNGDQSLYAKYRPTMISYLNLVWEQVYLVDEKLISKNLWRIWRKLIASVVQTEFAKQIIFEFEYDDIIREFRIEKAQISTVAEPPNPPLKSDPTCTT